MAITVMKTFFEKLQPRVMNYKYFKNVIFKTDLLSKLGKVNKLEMKTFSRHVKEC